MTWTRERRGDGWAMAQVLVLVLGEARSGRGEEEDDARFEINFAGRNVSQCGMAFVVI